jgi:hypothetical protein
MIPGSIGRFFFDISLKINFGCATVKWAKENQERIDKISKKYKFKYHKRYGKPLDWKKKSTAFERAIKNRHPAMASCKISELRELVWTWRNWYDEAKKTRQELRIKREGIMSFLNRG